MFQVLNCLTTEHDWRLVVVAGIVCFVASLTAINLFHRARAALGGVRSTWILAAGVMVGCGIWATHFIAMLAYEPGVPVAYGVGQTALSLLAAMVITAFGLRLRRRWQRGLESRRSAARSLALASRACTTSACGRWKCRAI